MKHSEDFRSMSKVYENMRQGAIMSYSVGINKIELVKEEETSDWIINWYEDNVYNKDKSIKTTDKEEAESIFQTLKSLIIKESVKKKPFDSMIKRNVSYQLTNAPFLLSSPNGDYPCKDVTEAKELAKSLKLNPQILI